jgi:hypothetical protein
MPDSANKNGKLLTLYELLSSQEVTITIPIIQRDYAQGRDEQLVEEIRERFLEALLNAVRGIKPLVLDFVYGSIHANFFTPIDGQQRLTTLFLLHWYLAVTEKREPDEYSYLKKFTYEIRESAGEFCHALVSHHIDLPQQSHSLSKKIREANWYHHVYDNDPTVQAMLRMLDAIDDKFRGIESGYENLVAKDAVSFWWLSLEEFGLTDDLFIKMNARGKRLTCFEIFKGEAEQATEVFKDDAEAKKLREYWLDNIDNDWLDTFWAQSKTPQENAEDNMFRFILFLLRTIEAEESGKYEEIGPLEYAETKNDIQMIHEAGNLEFICSSLDAWDIYVHYEPIQNMLLRIISGDVTTFYERAIVFGTIAYGNRHPASRTNDAFFRILKYLAIGHRHVREDSKNFENDLNASNYGSFIRYLMHFINGIPTEGDNLGLLQSMINTPDSMATFRHAIEKAAFCLSGGKLDQSRYDEIQAIEDMDCFCGQIHNVFFEGQLWLSSQKMGQLLKIQKSNPRLLLRCIQAMSNKALLTYKYYGSWKWTKANGKEDLFALYKNFYGFCPSDSGDYLWAANPDRDLSKAVRGFIRECAELPFADVEKELENWLKGKIDDQQNYAGLAPYIVKHDEFLGYAGGKPNGSVYLIPDYASFPCNDWIRVFGNLEAGRNYHSFWVYGTHYNPFVMALHNRLEMQNVKTRIMNCWMCNEPEASILDEWVELSNGRKLRLMINSKWERYWELDGETVWDCSDVDCIEVAFQNIIAMD